MAENEKPRHVGPGQRLRAAREAGSLQIEDVARELHLSRAVIQAMELDDFASLGAPVFARGYLTSYARLLGLPIGPLLVAYKQATADQASAPELKPAPRLERRSTDVPMRLVTYAIATVLSLLLLIWWRTVDQPVPLHAGDPLPGEVLPTLSVTAADSSQVSVPDLPAMEPEPGVTLHGEGVPGEAVGDEPVAEVPEPPVSQTTMPGDRLFLRFREDSWVKITDGEGARRLMGVMRAGSAHEIEGAAPFTVVLGNSPAVELEFNGEAVDTGPYTRRNGVANLVLTGKETADIANRSLEIE